MYYCERKRKVKRGRPGTEARNNVFKGSQVVVVLHGKCLGPFSYSACEHQTFWKALVYRVCVVYIKGGAHTCSVGA